MGYIWVYIWVIYGLYTFIYLNPKPFLDYDPFPISNDLPVWKKTPQTAAITGPKNRGFSRYVTWDPYGQRGKVFHTDVSQILPKIHR